MPPEYWQRFKEEWDKDSGIHIVNDVDQEDPHIRDILTLVFPTDMSHLRMELELEKQKLGWLSLFTEGKHRYIEHHSRLISLLHEPFAVAISNILQHQEILRLKDMLADDNRYLQRQMLQMTGDTIIGANFGLKRIMEMVAQVAPLSSPVLLMGETGVGKEVIANTIHFSSERKDNPFIKVNCGAIPETLIDSELFGHEKGAFTGAVSRKRGRFERAHLGTIFLDEIGELPAAAQVRLLRVLQQHEIERVGGTETIPVDVRVISATHQNLEQMVRNGQFREDLWFRLNVFPIMIPPLRHRAGDIPALIDHFIEKKKRELKIRTQPIPAPGTLEKLQSYPWSGNVRELENMVERALILYQIEGSGGKLTFDPLSGGTGLAEDGIFEKKQDIDFTLDEMIADYIVKTLAQTGGRVEGKNGAAQKLGIHPSTLRGKMRKLDISYCRQSKRSKYSL